MILTNKKLRKTHHNLYVLNNFLLLVLLSTIVSGCAKNPTVDKYLDQCEIVENSGWEQNLPGPEDIVHDRFSSRDRLLISVQNRDSKDNWGRIDSYNPESGQAITMKILDSAGNPLYDFDSKENVVNTNVVKKGSEYFLPHGMDIVNEDSNTYLYVISHPPINRNLKKDLELYKNKILKFLVSDSELTLEKEIESDYFRHPNDLIVNSNGRILVTDNPDLNLVGIFKMLFHQSQLISINDDDYSDQLTISGFKFANGLLEINDDLLISGSLGENYKLEDYIPINKKKIQKEQSNYGFSDNFSADEEHSYLAVHRSLLDLMRHLSVSSRSSDWYVVEKTNNEDRSIVMTASDKSVIQGVSVAVPVSGQDGSKSLFLGQVAGNGIAKCKL